jgi:hypothetical protein
MQTLYSDASGHDAVEVPSVIAAGWVSSVETWIAFDSEWRKYVSAHCQTDCFHMTDFKGNKGKFSDWKDREHEKEAFLNGLADLIEGNTFQSFVVSIRVEDYRDAKTGHSLDAWLGNAYACAARGLSSLAKIWSFEEDMSLPRFVFEKGDAGQDQLFLTMKRDGYAVPDFEPKCSAAGLQAADMLAWYAKEDDRIRRSNPDLSLLDPIFLRFHNRRRKYWLTFNKMSFDRMAKYMQIDPQDFETLRDFKQRDRREKRNE